MLGARRTFYLSGVKSERPLYCETLHVIPAHCVCQVQAALEAGGARQTSYLSGVNSTHCIVRLSL